MAKKGKKGKGKKGKKEEEEKEPRYEYLTSIYPSLSHSLCCQS